MDGISALMDGELEDNEAQRQIALLKSDGQSRERWEEFHLIGDALRGEAVLRAGFAERFSRRLAEEPTVLAPRRMLRKPTRVTTYALSAAASVSAAALVAWVALTPAPQGGAEMIARKAAPAAPAVVVDAALQALPNVSSDGRMNEYLLAHEGLSPSSALQGLAPYIRTVSTRAGDGR